MSLGGHGIFMLKNILFTECEDVDINVEDNDNKNVEDYARFI